MSEREKQQAFYDRADAFIKLANEQMDNGVATGEVSASFMYGLARYSAWFSASGWQSAKDMAEACDETIAFFVEEYRRMLEINMDDYINNFKQYVEASEQVRQQG